MGLPNALALQEAVTAICPEIQSRVEAHRDQEIQERQLWWELSCCVLSSQVPFRLAAAAASRIDEVGILSDVGAREAAVVKCELHRLLSEPLPFGNGHRRYRFPASRADQLTRAWSAVRETGGSLGKIVAGAGDAAGVRAWLVRSVPGLGPKQASMFLRNVGASYELAVLDRHVLGYMAAVGLCETSPKGISNLPAYQRHETALRSHADRIGYPVGLIDWAIWIVMRVAGDQRVVGGLA